MEAARIDGANEWYLFWKIVMSLSKTLPGQLLVVFSFVANWNDYFSPLIFITSQAVKRPGTSDHCRQLVHMKAGAVGAPTFLMTLQTIIIFTLMQARVMETMVHSGN